MTNNKKKEETGLVQPTYQPQISASDMQAAYNKAYNRQPFSYDSNTDKLYQNWYQNYMNNGKKVMQDTVGNAALLTGGYGNSYGVTAGQQVYDQYAANAADKADEFRNNAYNNWLNEGKEAQQAYGAMVDADNRNYNRYLDQLSQYNNNRNYAYQLDRDKASDDRWQKEFDRQNYENDRSFAEKQRQYDADMALQNSKFEESKKQWQKEYDYNISKAKENAESGKKFNAEDVYDFIKKNKNTFKSEEELANALFEVFQSYGDDFYDLMDNMTTEDGQSYYDLVYKKYENELNKSPWSQAGLMGIQAAQAALKR